MATITCPICGRRVMTTGASGPPSLCPTCGASLLAPDDDSRDDSDTRPVPPEQIPTRPEQLERMESGETRDLPPSALPPPALPSPAKTEAKVAVKAAGKAAARGAASQFWRGLSVVALLALLLALVAGAALVVNGGLPFGQQTASPTATTSAPSPSATPATTM